MSNTVRRRRDSEVYQSYLLDRGLSTCNLGISILGNFSESPLLHVGFISQDCSEQWLRKAHYGKLSHRRSECIKHDHRSGEANDKEIEDVDILSRVLQAQT
jgi:hypothetical protein